MNNNNDRDMFDGILGTCKHCNTSVVTNSITRNIELYNPSLFIVDSFIDHTTIIQNTEIRIKNYTILLHKYENIVWVPTYCLSLFYSMYYYVHFGEVWLKCSG